MEFNEYEATLWNLLISKGYRKGYYINGYFLTFEEAKEELKKEFNLVGTDLIYATFKAIDGSIFKKIELAGEVKTIPRTKMLKYLYN